MVFRAVVFTFLPTAIELVLVCGLLARTFTPIVSALVVGTFAAYVAWWEFFKLRPIWNKFFSLCRGMNRAK